MKLVHTFAAGLTLLGLLSATHVAEAQHDHAGPPPAPADHANHAMHADHTAMAAADTRQPVSFPAPLRHHTLSSMRDHLLALAEIQDALARGAPEQAASIAEQRLGMSSLQTHGAHESSKFMPQGMQDIGSAMHRSASRFAVAAQDAAVTGDSRPALAALARTTQACVACHAAYRLQ